MPTGVPYQGVPVKKKIVSLAAAVLASTTSLAIAADAASCDTLKLGDIGWTDNAANNGLTTVVAEALGYKVVKTTASVPIAMLGVKGGQLDAFLDYWSPALDTTVLPFKDDVDILPSPNMTGAKETLAVPRYLYDAGLKTFEDLPKFKDQLGSTIYGIEVGSGANKLIAKMIADNDYGTGGFRLLESSEAAMLVAVKRATAKQAPIVFVGWAPHPMNLEIDMVYLSGGDKAFGPDYGSAKVYTVLSRSFENTCTNPARLMRQLRFTPEMEASIMQAVMAKKDALDASRVYLKQHGDVLPAWLDGVKTVDGKDGLPAIRKSLGL
jgi:glycine betaine/proline transport system substrate-binding protein